MKLFVFDGNKWSYLTVWKNVIYKMCLEIIYLIYMYRKDLILNNL